MSDARPTIGSLLQDRQTTCLDLGGRLAEAQACLPTWKRLWREFGDYVEVRDRIVCRSEVGSLPLGSMNAAALVEHLTAVGLLQESIEGGHVVSSEDARQRLAGRWLEELGAVAARDAGAEEVRFSQRLTWRSRYGAELYQNEIDVLARYGDRLAFVSCKALAPWGATDPRGIKRIFEAIKEVAYWRQHFGRGCGEAILLTTVDFVDERAERYRNAGLIERAEVLGVQIVSADDGDYYGLVGAFGEAVASLRRS